MQMHCDDCTYYEYDEDDEAYYCGVNMDEDDYSRLMQGGSHSECPYYRNNNEYEVVKHQM